MVAGELYLISDKGIATCLTPVARSTYGKTPKLYYVVDLATRESYTLFFYTLDGLKKRKGSPALTPRHVIPARSASLKSTPRSGWPGLPS